MIQNAPTLSQTSPNLKGKSQQPEIKIEAKMQKQGKGKIKGLHVLLKLKINTMFTPTHKF